MIWQTMLYDLKSLERPQHLVAYVAGREEPLVDERIRQVGRGEPIWHFCSEELWTPGSGAKNSLHVWTAETSLLEVGLVDLSIHVSLLLPTDERLEVRVQERHYGARRSE